MKAISAKADGLAEEIWQSWKPKTVGTHTIDIRLATDENISDSFPDNNAGQITVFVDKDTDGDGIGDSVDPDIDGDGVPNAQDQFPLDPTMSKDTDHDGIDDGVDTDIDNDGLYNWDEKTIGTNPAKYDTDGDGVGDKEDAFPLDPKRWKPEAPPTQSQGGSGSGVPSTDQGAVTDNGATVAKAADSSDSASDASAVLLAAAAGGSADALVNAISETATADAAGTGLAPTSTEGITTPTTTQEITPSHEIVGSDHPANPGTNTSAGTRNASWMLEYGLWGLAILFGLAAFFFAWLSRKRKKEEELK
jgi:hypothetical protein